MNPDPQVFKGEIGENATNNIGSGKGQDKHDRLDPESIIRNTYSYEGCVEAIRDGFEKSFHSRILNQTESCHSFYFVQNSIPFIVMQFNKDQIRQLAQQAQMGPQKQIAVDLKRVKKEALFLQSKYEQARREGPVSSFDFLLHWETQKETKYLVKKVRSLARIISQGQFDRTKFDFMMNMGQMVKSGRMREYDASVAVGQRFANEYVTPAMREGGSSDNVTTSLNE